MVAVSGPPPTTTKRIATLKGQLRLLRQPLRHRDRRGCLRESLLLLPRHIQRIDDRLEPTGLGSIPIPISISIANRTDPTDPTDRTIAKHCLVATNEGASFWTGIAAGNGLTASIRGLDPQQPHGHVENATASSAGGPPDGIPRRSPRGACARTRLSCARGASAIDAVDSRAPIETD